MPTVEFGIRHRARVVMDKAAGILRIEGADSLDLQKPVFLRPAANAVGRVRCNVSECTKTFSC